MRTALLFSLFVGLLMTTTACFASKVSGTYVAHSQMFTEMLELTETSGGQVNGVLSSVTLKDDGSVRSEQTPLNGTTDADQLTLNTRTLLSFISGNTLAGTISGDAIRLHLMDSAGNVGSEAFVRSTPDQFEAYADELKSRGRKIVYNDKLVSLTQQYRQTVREAESWIANAQTHAARIQNAKADYSNIEDGMRALLGRERQTLDANTRTQIALTIQQGELTGEQLDMRIDQIWDMQIADTGSKLEKEFTSWDGNCGKDQELLKQGASAQTIAGWDTACRDVMSERTKFDPIYKRVAEERADLKRFEGTAQAHRKELVNEANHLQ